MAPVSRKRFYVLVQITKQDCDSYWRAFRPKEYGSIEEAKAVFEEVKLNEQITAKAVVSQEEGQKPVVELCNGFYQDKSTVLSRPDNQTKVVR